MRFLVDTNILVYAANGAEGDHRRAKEFIDATVDGSTPWSLTWPIIYEFCRVSTHHRVFAQPLSVRQAERFVDALLDSPTLTMLSPSARTPRGPEANTVRTASGIRQ